MPRGANRVTSMAIAPTYIGLDLTDPGLDWAAAGRTFGVPTVRVNDCAELASIVAAAPERDGPLLVEVPVKGHGS
jgi:benzoylformate decarboxylase